jgi:hypothetical protein
VKCLNAARTLSVADEIVDFIKLFYLVSIRVQYTECACLMIGSLTTFNEQTTQ